MKKYYYLLLAITFTCCKKHTPEPPAPPPPAPAKLLRVNSISATAFSGAEIGFDFMYSDTLVTKVVEHFWSTNDTASYVFHYTGSRLSGIDFFEPGLSVGDVPYKSFAISYTGDRISKAEEILNEDGSFVVSSYIEYTYDNLQRLSAKNSYNIISGVPEADEEVNYYYDDNDNIIKAVAAVKGTGAQVEFNNVFDNRENIFIKNNPAMLVFYWYLFDENQFKQAFPEVQLYSHNNLLSTTVSGIGLMRQVPFGIQLTREGLWDRIDQFPNVYSTSYPVIYYDMQFSYTLL